MTVTFQHLRGLSVLERAAVARAADAFDDAWQNNPSSPPDLASFLPADPRARLAALTELACLDLGMRLKRQEEARVEDYLGRFPELAADKDCAWALVTEECTRRGVAPEAAVEEYGRRFPEFGDRLQAWLPTQSLPSKLAGTAIRGPAALTAADPAVTAREAAGVPSKTRGGPPTLPGYEILGELGRGGMGVVYKARQTGLNRLVALKMILAGGHASKEEFARFRTEGEAIARLQHPHIVQVHEVGDHEGRPFFSLEFCSGGNLHQKLNGTPLPSAEAAALVEILARAMEAAHRRNVIHRDLKRANVLLTADGTPKITDFGLAKKLDGAGDTHTGAVMGTPSYMAPEQAAGKAKEVGPATDVYALGAILYECLTGRPPFRAATGAETIRQVLDNDPVSPRQLEPKTPRDLETICLKCLEKQPGRRYASAQALAEDLHRFLAGEPVRARPGGMAERAVKWARRRPTLTAAYGLLVTVLVLGLGGGGATSLWLRAENARGEMKKARDDAVRAKTMAETAQRQLESANGLLTTTQQDVKVALQGEKDAKRKLTQYSYADRINLAQREWDTGATQRARELLKEADALQEELTPGHRPWEWDYLDRAFHPELAVLEGHKREVVSAAFSPDGRSLVTASDDGTARLWDVASGKALAILQGHTGAVLAVAFSPDGSRVATAGIDGTARLWDAAAGKQLAVLEGHKGLVMSVVFSPDSTRVATAGQDSTARLWEVASGKALAVLRGHADQILAVAFSPNGTRVATAAGLGVHRIARQGHPTTGVATPTGFDNTARLWDATSGKQLAVLQGHKGDVLAVAFSPDGTRVATASQDRTARLWDSASRKQLAVFLGHTDWISSVAFSPDGQSIATGSYDNTARLWDAATGKAFAVLQGHTDWIVSMAFNHDGNCIATAGQDQTARLWDAGTGKQLAVLQGHTGGVASVAFSPDGSRVATASNDGTARLWDITSDKALAILQGHTGPVQNVAFSPDGSQVITAGGLESRDNTARLWNASSGKQLAILQGHTGPILSVAYSLDGSRVVTASYDNTVRLWEAASGEQLAILEGHGNRGPLITAAFSPDCTRVATASLGSKDTSAQLWDAASGKQLAILLGDGQPICRVKFSPNGDLVATASYQTARLWNAASGKERAVLQGHTGSILALGFSPDGCRVATAGQDQTVRLWDTNSGNQFAVLWGHTGWIASVAFSPDGNRIVTGSYDNTTRLWDAASGKQLAVLQGHKDPVLAVAFSPDSGRVATASADGTARLWIARESPEDREQRRRLWHEQNDSSILRLHESRPAMKAGPSLTSAAVTSDGRSILFGSQDSVVRLWDEGSDKPPREFKGHTDVVWSVALSPDGKLALSGSQDKSVRFWDVETGKEIHQYPSDGIVSSVRFSPDGKLAAATCWDKKVRFWQAATGKEVHVFSYDFSILDISFSPDGSCFLLGNTAGTPLLCDAETGKVLRTFEGHTDAVHNVAFSPDGKTALLASHDGTLKLWNVETGECVRTYRGHVGMVHEVRFLPNGKRMVSCGDDRTVRAWDVETGKEIARG